MLNARQFQEGEVDVLGNARINRSACEIQGSGGNFRRTKTTSSVVKVEETQLHPSTNYHTFTNSLDPAAKLSKAAPKMIESIQAWYHIPTERSHNAKAWTVLAIHFPCNMFNADDCQDVARSRSYEACSTFSKKDSFLVKICCAAPLSLLTSPSSVATSFSFL